MLTWTKYRRCVGADMRLFHQTKTQDAESIWNDGFCDSEVIVDDGCAGEQPMVFVNSEHPTLLQLHQEHDPDASGSS